MAPNEPQGAVPNEPQGAVPNEPQGVVPNEPREGRWRARAALYRVARHGPYIQKGIQLKQSGNEVYY